VFTAKITIVALPASGIEPPLLPLATATLLFALVLIGHNAAASGHQY